MGLVEIGVFATVIVGFIVHTNRLQNTIERLSHAGRDAE